MGRHWSQRRSGKNFGSVAPELLTAYLTHLPDNPGDGGWTGNNLEGQFVVYSLQERNDEEPYVWSSLESDSVPALPATIDFTQMYTNGKYYRLAVNLGDGNWIYSEEWQFNE